MCEYVSRIKVEDEAYCIDLGSLRSDHPDKITIGYSHDGDVRIVMMDGDIFQLLFDEMKHLIKSRDIPVENPIRLGTPFELEREGFLNGFSPEDDIEDNYG